MPPIDIERPVSDALPPADDPSVSVGGERIAVSKASDANACARIAGVVRHKVCDGGDVCTRVPAPMMISTLPPRCVVASQRAIAPLR